MKKVGVLVISLVLISVLLVGVVSAGFWDCFKPRTTGQVIAENSLVAKYDFDSDASDSSGNGYDWVYAFTTSRYEELTWEEHDLIGTTRYLKICRTGAGHTRDNIAIDNVQINALS